MFEWMMCGLVASIFLQPSKPRLFACAVFTVGPISHNALFGDVNSPLYFITGMLWSAATVILLSGVRPLSKLVIKLQRICMAFIVVDFIGMILWINYFPSIVNQYSCIALYCLALIFMITWDKQDVHNHDSWGDCLRGFGDIISDYNNKNRAGTKKR